MTTYTVCSGDTLSTIAAGHSTSVNNLQAANPGIVPENLQIGQVIHLPDLATYQPPAPTNGTAVGLEGGTNGGGGYIQYSGPASSFPPPAQWASYQHLWELNERLLKMHDTDSEIALLRSAIETVSASSGIDARAILCIIVQESGGDVRVGSTDNGIHNPGLMQSHNGVSFDARDPAGSILQMVRDGTEGTKDGDGLKQLVARYGGDYYEAFRAYNSGSIDARDLNDAVGATGSYVRDAANRLMGHEWSGM